MTMKARKYKAFISYSHEDRNIVERIHKRIEFYKMPKALVGKTTHLGEIPSTLYPVFRDRLEAGAGSSLDTALQGALDQSDCLIVVCSPAAASSPFVDQEIAYFKQKRGSDRILPIIVGGDPAAAFKPEDCFPKALRVKVAEDGTITDILDQDPLAADARDEGDREELAVLKVIAGMIGVGLGELVQRDLVEKRRRQRTWYAIALSMMILFFLAATAAFAFNVVSQRNARLLSTVLDQSAKFVDAATSAVSERGLPLAISAGLIQRAADMVTEVHKGGSTSADVLHRVAGFRIILADNYRQINDAENRSASAQEALKIMQQLAAGSGANIEMAADLARAHLEVGKSIYATVKSEGTLEKASRSERALQEFDRCLDVVSKMSEAAYKTHAAALATLSHCHRWEAQLLKAMGRDKSAFEHSYAALELAKTAFALSDRDGKSVENLALAFTALAEHLRQTKSFDRALHMATEAMDLLSGAGGSSHAQSQVNLLQSGLRIVLGDIHMFRDEPDKKEINFKLALEEYKRSASMRNAAAALDRSNISLQKDYAWSLLKVAEAYRALSTLKLAAPFDRATTLREAAESYADAKKILASPSAFASRDYTARRYLALAHSGLSGVLTLSGKIAEAIPIALERIEVTKSLLSDDPDSQDVQRELAYGYHELAAMYATREQFADALLNNEASLPIFQRHADEKPGNFDYQRIYALALDRTAECQLAVGKPTQARDTAVLARSRRLKALDLAVARNRAPVVILQSRRNAANSTSILAKAHLALAECAPAMAAFAEAMRGYEEVLSASNNPEWVDQRDKLAQAIAAAKVKCEPPQTAAPDGKIP